MPQERLPWFPCEHTKLLAALAQMQPAEGYVYCIMLLRIYECGGSCPDDLDAIANRTRFNKRVTADALERLFRSGRLVREPDGIHNPKADVIIASAQRLREKRQEAGREGGFRTAGKPKENQQTSPSKATDLPPAKSSYLHLHLHKQEEDSLFRSVPPQDAVEQSGNRASDSAIGQQGAVAKATRSDIGKEFEEFWTAYPRRDGANPKAPAKKKFVALGSSPEVRRAMIAAAARYAAEMREKGKERTPYVVQATRWFNERRWEDYAAPPDAHNEPAYLKPPPGMRTVEESLAELNGGKSRAETQGTSVRRDPGMGQAGSGQEGELFVSSGTLLLPKNRGAQRESSDDQA